MALAWVVFLSSFLLCHLACRGQPHQPVQAKNPVARLGLILQFIAVGFAWLIPSSSRPEPALRLCAAGLAVASIGLAGWSLYHLGRYWHLDALVRCDHQLVSTGPYRRLRHPIYTAFAGMVLATLLWRPPTAWSGLVLGLFVAGTELRVRCEERLLRQHFGEEYEQYQRRTFGWLPPFR